MQDHLNFSAQIFKRKDGAWGMVYPQDDGTFKTVGFIGDLFLKKADFAIGNVIIFQTRAQFVDYLPAVGIYQGKCRLQHKKFLTLPHCFLHTGCTRAKVDTLNSLSGFNFEFWIK